MYTAYTFGTVIKSVTVFVFNPGSICPNLSGESMLIASND